jgi:hypothetical protein
MHELHELFADRQSQARATELAGGGAIGLGERIEDARLVLGRNADAGIT